MPRPPLDPNAMTEVQKRGQRGGRISTAARRGDSEWGRWMLRRRGWLAMTRAYPTLHKLWLANAGRRLHGLPPLPVPAVEPGRAQPESEVRVQRGRSKTKGSTPVS